MALDDADAVRAVVSVLVAAYAVTLAQSIVVNDKAADSRIRDANIAEESSNLTKYSILTQSGVAALAQANQSTGAVLALLR